MVLDCDRRVLLRDLLRTLPVDIPDPELSVDDDDDITLDWDLDRGRVFSLHITRTGVIGFAWLCQPEHAHGRFVLERDGRVPDGILGAIRRVLGTNDAAVGRRPA